MFLIWKKKTRWVKTATCQWNPISQSSTQNNPFIAYIYIYITSSKTDIYIDFRDKITCQTLTNTTSTRLYPASTDFQLEHPAGSSLVIFYVPLWCIALLWVSEFHLPHIACISLKTYIYIFMYMYFWPMSTKEDYHDNCGEVLATQTLPILFFFG